MKKRMNSGPRFTLGHLYPHPNYTDVLAESNAKDYREALAEFRQTFPDGEYEIRNRSGSGYAQRTTTEVERMMAREAEAAKERARLAPLAVWRDALYEVGQAIAGLLCAPDTGPVIHVLETYQTHARERAAEIAKELGETL